jgi:hypothetical protein
LVLFGERRQGQPALVVDDFIVALRSSLSRYAERNGSATYVSYPTLSIDPTPETVRLFVKLERQFTESRLREEMDQMISRWQEICAGAQNVRIEGVPRSSRFAQVMLDADYRLKQIADGTDDLQVPGLPSIMRASLDQAIAAADHNEPVGMSITSRFWFTAGQSYYSSGRITFQLERVDVRLQTEAEFATETGLLKKDARTDKLSDEFACRFSSQFPKIADLHSTYRDLENLYRWMALARVMVDEEPIDSSRADLAVLTDKFKLSEFEVPETVPGRSAVGRHDSGSYFIRIPSCGGVELQFRRGSVSRRPEKIPLDDFVGNRILSSRPKSTRLAVWKVS